MSDILLDAVKRKVEPLGLKAVAMQNQQGANLIRVYGGHGKWKASVSFQRSFHIKTKLQRWLNLPATRRKIEALLEERSA